jgi:predicted regulator of Ras-like GTPase activity (Roadblock/LC7/MglB family)
MTALRAIAEFPEVRGAVLGDLTGVFLDAVGEQDGETIAAVMGFVASALVKAGEVLGLGALRRVAVSGATRASLVVLDGQQVLAVQVEPPRSLAAVERQVETSIPGQG